MKLYLMRHGTASDRAASGADHQRALTEEGRIETRLVAQALKRLSVKPDLVMASPLVRAYQTAEILADELGAKNALHICEALAPAGSPSDLYKSLRDFKNADEVVLVGHEPDMGELASTLLWAGPEFDMPFKKAGVCRIDISAVPPDSPGLMRFFITPKISRLMLGK